MSTQRSVWFFTAAFAAGLGVAFLGPRGQSQAPQDPTELQVQNPIGGVRRVVFAQPFELASSAVHRARADKANFAAGWLVVFSVDPALALPRQEPEPVLQFGDELALRVNHGYPDGMQVAVLPVGQDQALGTALAQLPLWFGEPGVPDQLSELDLDSRLALAQANGVGARPLDEVRAATARAGAARKFSGEDELWRAAAQLVLEWAPSERELAQGFLLPPPR